MDTKLKLVKLDAEYCNFLRKFDNRVPYNGKSKEQRPFVGVLFMIDSYYYFAPLSSPKPKHLKMKNTIDFFKIDSGKLGAVNFNNMLPVKEDNIKVIDLNKKIYNKEKQDYNRLLQSQIFWLNRNKEELYNSSRKLYNKYINNTLPKNIKDRCCNFKLLEEKCNLYNNVKVVS